MFGGDLPDVPVQVCFKSVSKNTFNVSNEKYQYGGNFLLIREFKKTHDGNFMWDATKQCR